MASVDDLGKHGKDSRAVQSNLVQLNQHQVILYRISIPNDDDSIALIRVHGILMIVTWIFIVSTGMLISRYFKETWKNALIGRTAAWFDVHRLLMSLAAILTLVGFFVIVIFLQGTWIHRGWTRSYAHSVTGALVIGLAYCQLFMALFRCESNSRYRWIFNTLHAAAGVVAFVLSVVTLFLATYMSLFQDIRARIVMMIWTGWIVVVFTSFECIHIHYGKRYSRDSEETPLVAIQSPDDRAAAEFGHVVKTLLLVVHIFVAILLSTLFVAVVVTS